MKLVFIFLTLVTISSAEFIPKECEDAIIKATEIHEAYTNGDKTITETYNATAKMEKICDN